MMKASAYFRLAAIGVALFTAGHAAAQEPPLPAEPLQQRERVRTMSADDRTAQREQMQERVRNMTPEEQRLMREASVDGRARMESRQSAQGEVMRRGGGYGQGYESRRGDGSSAGGGGRGMGGGRHR